MQIAGRLLDGLAERTTQLVGVLFGSGAIAHFATWVGEPGEPVRRAVATGDVIGFVQGLLAYAEAHPAYALAFLAGLGLVSRR